ncbi:MCP four helix bundle domain-containing protein [Pedobacter aquatilis]|uniref:MCP four helix bundle domain-containing protein n=1 Tax=Pedobacter aquatilis TaxID=351343 RepID=UPI002931577E|nr:MCP four helix bundle domain-containing protein [Pedobacter aquatilis]
MKFAFSIKNKIKIAFLLFCIMCCTLLIRFLEDKSVTKINDSFISMYNDRLVPATDLFFIAENLYHKNSLLQDAFGSDKTNSSTIISKIEGHNRKIDSVINKYELTFLVKQEKAFLNDLKNALKTQHQMELQLFNVAEDEAERIYETVGRKTFAQTLTQLSKLIKIQSKVGDELIKDSKIFVSGTKVYSFFQVLLAIAIGALIVNIVSASNVVKVQQDKFNLN